MQEDLKEKQRSLKYISKIMNSIKQNYTISEKEMLVVIQTIKE